jgi:hypothetical protein
MDLRVALRVARTLGFGALPKNGAKHPQASFFRSKPHFFR